VVTLASEAASLPEPRVQVFRGEDGFVFDTRTAILDFGFIQAAFLLLHLWLFWAVWTVWQRHRSKAVAQPLVRMMGIASSVLVVAGQASAWWLAARGTHVGLW
jgi:hypothetical protein